MIIFAFSFVKMDMRVIAIFMINLLEGKMPVGDFLFQGSMFLLKNITKKSPNNCGYLYMVLIHVDSN